MFSITARADLAVTNVVAVQRADGTGLVDVYYDLSGATGPVIIDIAFSSNNGSTWNVLPTTSLLSGDFGSGITNGDNKHIVWDAPRDRASVNWPNARARVTATQLDTAVTLQLPGSVPLEMVPIPPGTFTMGSGSDPGYSQANEAPQHTVNMGYEFYIGKFEVTQAQWTAVMGINPSTFGDPQKPVESISWNDCQSFIAALNTLGLGTFRLPTEAEWEYACRAGSTTRWYFGNDEAQLVNYAWYLANSDNETKVVGQKLPNAFGLFDMHGNVWEWTQDWYHSNYNGAPNDGSVWESPEGTFRAMRNGAFRDPANACRSAYRNGTIPDGLNNDGGVRLVWAPYPETITLQLPGGVPLEMMPIQSGSFSMGSVTDPGYSEPDEEPQHTVNIAYDFYIGKFEVTQAQWQAVMGANPSNFAGANLPVERVSWNDCQSFITALNALGIGTFRLPSEAEWEYACRAGTTTRWYFGDDGVQLSTYAWGIANSDSQTKAVGQKLPNAFGLYDMHGNVWEWVQDWLHSSYDGAPTNGSAWEIPTWTLRVGRGGSWNNFAVDCRSANRGNDDPDYRGNNLGLRLVWTSNITLQLPGAVPLEMARIPAGSFAMGSVTDPGYSQANEEPQHTVNIGYDFYIGKFEVTQAQWQAVMGSNPSNFSGADRPVERVSWDNCNSFITALNALGIGTFRLPTEAEWEYACRAESTTRWYFGSDDTQMIDYAWYNVNSADGTKVVGQMQPNAFGLHDMHGNVFEWTQDWNHDDYQGAPNDGSAWESPEGTRRVLRGGAWNGDAVNCRSAYRASDTATQVHYTYGVRLVRIP